MYYKNTYDFRCKIQDEGLIIEMRKDKDFEPFITELKSANIQASKLYLEIFNFLNL